MRSVLEIQQILKAINRWHKNKEKEKPGKNLKAQPKNLVSWWHGDQLLSEILYFFIAGRRQNLYRFKHSVYIEDDDLDEIVFVIGIGLKSGRMSKLMKDFSFWITTDAVDNSFIFYNQEKEVLELHQVYQSTDIIDVRNISETGWFKCYDF